MRSVRACRRAGVLGVLGVLACGRSEPSAQAHFEPPAAPLLAVMQDRISVLRVCADPNNLPFSNRRLEGFENRIAELIAEELDARVEYTWWAQRRGFFRNTLRANLCDVVIGVPSAFELAATTTPYYRSSYVFVTRRGGPDIRTLDDPRLRTLRIGLTLVGDDGSGTPPAHALARRGIIENVRGYSAYGDYSRESPPADVIAAVARSEVDVAIAWGPMAGYFARRQREPLRVVPVSPAIDPPFLPFTFDISLGVRRGDPAFLAKLDSVLVRRRTDIDRILEAYGVPRT